MACIAKRRGVWVVDYRDALGKRRREVVEGNRDDAKERLGEILKGEGQMIETKKTFREYAEEWLGTHAKTELKQSTRQEYEAAFRNHLFPAFGPLPFSKVSRPAVKKFIANKIDAGLSRSTIKNIIIPIREMYNHAIDDGVISFNPAARIGRFNRKRVEGKRVDPLARQEVSILLQCVEEKLPHYYPLLLCAARTGLREGELIGLKGIDVDFNGRFIEVKRNISRGQVTTPKNGKTRRVDMSLQLTNVLDDLLARKKALALQKELEKAPKDRCKPEEVTADVMANWIFTTPEGTQLDPNNVRKRVFYRALDLAGLKRIRFHDLRHTFASLLIQQGESLVYVKDQLGHSSIQITVDTYGHLVPGGNRQAVDRLDDAEEENCQDANKSGHKLVTTQKDRGADYA